MLVFKGEEKTIAKGDAFVKRKGNQIDLQKFERRVRKGFEYNQEAFSRKIEGCWSWLYFV
jgi:hypothetical protein